MEIPWFDSSKPTPPKNVSVASPKAAIQESQPAAPPPPLVVRKTNSQAESKPCDESSASKEESLHDVPENEPVKCKDKQINDDPQVSATSSKDIAPAPSSSIAAPRELTAMEAARSVEEAVKAKEALVRMTLQKAQEDMVAKRKELEERRRREEKELEEQERELQRLHVVAQGDGVDNARVQHLRNAIEEIGREMRYLERDVAAKLAAMQRATEAYCTAQESLASQRDKRKRLEDEMLELMLSAGKAKDEKLNDILQKI